MQRIGSSLVTEESASTARAFLDPTFNHFVQILLTACLLLVPSMGAGLLGSLLLVLGVLRLGTLVHIYRHMRRAHARNNDMELSDWLSNVVAPLVCHGLVAASGVLFLLGHAVAFSTLAIAVITLLLLGVFAAWEILVWMALAGARSK